MKINPNLEPVTATTQEHLDIYDIIDNLVVMKNGTVSMVIETSAVNFDLLSESEQDARISAFAGLLNSLNFHIQIVVRTQNVDVAAYIKYLEKQKEKRIAPKIKMQIEIYQQFVRNLIKDRNVLDKRFFVVIPYSAGIVQRTGLLKQLFGRQAKITNLDWILDKAKTNLYPKRDHIIRELKRMGVNARPLVNEELIGMYHSVYNPGSSRLHKIQLKSEEYEAPIIEGPRSNKR